MARKKKKKIGLFLNKKFDHSILIITLILLCLGLIMLLSASAPKSYSEDGTSYSYVIRQGGFAILGIIAMFAISKFDYRNLKKFKWFKWALYIGTVVLLLLVEFIGVGEKGAKRWIAIANFNFQPSEVAKVAFIVFYADLLSSLKESNKINKFVMGFIYPLLFLIPVGVTIFYLQNHLSATVIIIGITFIQMFVAGTLLRYFIGAGSVGVAGIAAILMKMMADGKLTNFRFGRIQTWLDIEHASLTDEAWQINQSLYAIGSGGLFGVGLGKSNQKHLYLPEPHNDFIFSVLAEEWGFFGCSMVIILFILFVWRGIVIAIKSEDTFGSLIAIGITTMIGLQALINIAVVTNTIPVTGISLPFFSYGGTAMIMDLAAVGLLLSVSRNSKKSN